MSPLGHPPCFQLDLETRSAVGTVICSQFGFASLMELGELQRIQEDHDRKFHKDVMGWDKAKQIEHCTFHLTKIAGLFSTYCEKVHHGEPYDTNKLASDRIPDILIFALKFANLFDQNLEETYLKRIKTVEARRKL